MKNSYLVGIGEILWDVDTMKSTKTLGGAPANFAYHAGEISRLIGADMCGLAVSAIGHDRLADETLAQLKAVQLKTQLSVVEYNTGIVNIEYDEKGEPDYDIVENAAWDHISFGGLENIAAQTRVVCFGTLAQRSPESRNTIRRFLDAVPSTCLKVCDINLRKPFYSKEIVEESIGLCNILKINEDEAVYIAKLFWEVKTAEPRRRKTVEKSALVWTAAKHNVSGNGNRPN